MTSDQHRELSMLHEKIATLQDQNEALNAEVKSHYDAIQFLLNEGDLDPENNTVVDGIKLLQAQRDRLQADVNMLNHVKAIARSAEDLPKQ